MNIGDIFLNGTNSTTRFKDITTVGGLTTLFINGVFVFAGLIILFFFIMGGIGMIGSAGKNDPQKAEQAKKTITSALIGFVVVFTAYWIVKLVLQLLGIDNLI